MVICDDREDFDGFVRDVIEHPDFAHTEAELWLAKTPKPLDPAFAPLSGLVAEVRFDRVPDFCAPACGESPHRSNGARGQNDLEAHFGQILARSPQLDKALELTGLRPAENW